MILALNGSPRKHGTVASLMRSVSEGLPSGTLVEWIDIYSLRMSPCVACMACRSKGVCVMPEDDAHRVGRLICEAEGYIIGTPVHWGNVSAQLKLLLDRNVPVFMSESPRGIPIPKQKGKRAVIVSACTTPWPFNIILPESRGAVRVLKEVLHTGGIKIVAKVIKPGTKRNPAISPSLQARARQAGQRLGRR